MHLLLIAAERGQPAASPEPGLSPPPFQGPKRPRQGRTVRSAWLPARGAELLFQILTGREEKSSTAGASNLPVSESGKVIGDARLVSAAIDRVVFNARVIETGTEFYRLRVTPQRRSTGEPNQLSTVGPIRVDIPRPVVLEWESAGVATLLLPG